MKKFFINLVFLIFMSIIISLNFNSRYVFANLTKNIGYNEQWSCGYVAIGILLFYYNKTLVFHEKGEVNA